MVIGEIMMRNIIPSFILGRALHVQRVRKELQGHRGESGRGGSRVVSSQHRLASPANRQNPDTANQTFLNSLFDLISHMQGDQEQS